MWVLKIFLGIANLFLFLLDVWQKTSKNIKVAIFCALGLFIAVILYHFTIQSDNKPTGNISIDNSIDRSVTNNTYNNQSVNISSVDISKDLNNTSPEVNTSEVLKPPKNNTPAELNGFTIVSLVNGKLSNSLSEKLISILQPKLNNEKFIYSSLVNEDCFQKALGGDMSCLSPSLNKSAIRYVVLVQGVEEEHSIQSYAGSVLLTVQYSGSILDNRSQQVIKRFEYSGRASNINSRLAKEEVEPKFLDSLKKIYIEL